MTARRFSLRRDSFCGKLCLTVVVCSTLIVFLYRCETTCMLAAGASQQLQTPARGRVAMSYVRGDTAQVMRSDRTWSGCRVVGVMDDGSVEVKIDGTALTKIVKSAECVKFLRMGNEAKPVSEKVKGFKFKFDADDLNQLKLTFGWLDVDGQGLIDLAGLTRGFRLFPGPYGKLNKHEVAHIFDLADANGDGYVDLTEFVFWVVKTNHEMQAFHVADLDDDGLIDVAEFRYAVKATHPKVFGPAIDALFATADINADGKISFVEYMRATNELAGQANKA